MFFNMYRNVYKYIDTQYEYGFQSKWLCFMYCLACKGLLKDSTSDPFLYVPF